MKKTIFIFFILSSLNSYSSMKCLNGLRSIISGKPREKFKIISHRDKYWRYRKYENGATFVTQKNKLFHKIDFWARIGERDIRLRELRKKQARSLVNETIGLDTPQISLIVLRPMFTRIQINYFKMTRNNYLFERLHGARHQFVEGNRDAGLKIIAELKEKYLLRSKIGQGSNRNIVYEIDLALTKIENSNIDITIEFAKRYAEYTETIETLYSTSNKPGKLQEKARSVLRLLEPKELIPEQFEHFEHFEKISHLRQSELREIVLGNRISEVIYLRRELLREKWSSIVSRLSATQIYEIADMIARKFPWLNTPSIRSQIRYTVDNKEILTYYPNIDRMVSGGTSPKVMWEYLLRLDARDRTTDSLIKTFARRVDTRVEWRKVKEYGAIRANKLREQGHKYDLEVRLYEKMLEMEKAVTALPPLAPWHRSGNTQVVRFLLDGILMGAFAYGSYYFLGDLFDIGNDEKKGDQPTESLDGLDQQPQSNLENTPNRPDNITTPTENPFPPNSLDLEREVEKAASDYCGQFASCTTVDIK